MTWYVIDIGTPGPHEGTGEVVHTADSYRGAFGARDHACQLLDWKYRVLRRSPGHYEVYTVENYVKGQRYLVLNEEVALFLDKSEERGWGIASIKRSRELADQGA